MLSHRVVLSLAVLLSVAAAQSVVSVRSGLIHFAEGSVLVDNQLVEQKFGKFPEVREGSELRTENGRAEILLTPGTLLRIGENSAIKMVSTRLSATKVEFLRGSAILECDSAAPGTSVTIVYKSYQLRFSTPGLYRINADPAELKVRQGEADVAYDDDSVVVSEGRALSLGASLETPKFDHRMDDALDRWSRSRSVTVAVSNAAAAHTDDMAALIDQWQTDPFVFAPSYSSFPYIPMTGGPAVAGGFGYGGFGYGGYGSWIPPSLYYGPRPGYYYNPSRYSSFYGSRPFSPLRPAQPIAPFHPVPRNTPTPARGGGVMMSPGAGSRPAAGSSGGRVGGHR